MRRALLHAARHTTGRRALSTQPQSLQQLVEHAENADAAAAARWTHSELSTRCEEQVARLAALQADAPTARDLATLASLYGGVAKELAAGDELDLSRPDELNALHRALVSVEQRHATFVPSVVEALREGAVPEASAGALEEALAAHIGMAVLLRNHLLAHAPELENPGGAQFATIERNVGAARLAAPLRSVVNAAIGDAQLVCEHAYDLADPPAVDVRGPEDAAGPCVPAHATHVVRELVKNALVATLEAHVAEHGDVPDDWDEAPRAVVVDVDHGYVTVMDSAGGIEQEALDACLKIRPGLSRYDRLDEPGGSYNSGSQTPISGVGMGLPLSKLYAEHFGGGLDLVSGVGEPTTATLRCPPYVDLPEQLPPEPEAANTAWGRR